MGTEIDYKNFLEALDNKLKSYFSLHSDKIYCKKGCSLCCEKGDYPLTEIELKYLMQGYIALDNQKKVLVQENIKSMKKGGSCPFLLDSECSVYGYRPIICRVHGLAYLYKENCVKLPYCVNFGLNYRGSFGENEFVGEPVEENLDTQELLKDFESGEIRNLYDWLKS